MLGLPNQDIEALRQSLKEAINLNPEHISIYSLILEEGTKLEEKIRKNELKMLDEDVERQMYWETKYMLEKSGYIHYEISNFAKPNFESKHNLDCWKQKEYLGLGAAAHSYIDKKRYSNTTSIEEYIKNIKRQEFGKNITIYEEQTKGDMRKGIYDFGVEKTKRGKYQRI